MASQTVADLDSAAPVSSNVFHHIPSGGVDKKATLAEILTALGVTAAAVASLGSAATSGANTWKYATNGRKLGEGVGAGTGVLVRSDGTNWRTVDQGSIVAA